MAEEQPNRELQFLKVYLKDCSIESPNAPAIFTEQGESKFSLNLEITDNKVDEFVHEVVLSVAATATLGDKTLFMVEVKQAGLFHMKGFDDEYLEQLLGIWAPSQLYPYARAVVQSAATDAGFPQVLMPLVNFESLYEQRKAQQQQAGNGGQAPAPQGEAN